REGGGESRREGGGEGGGERKGEGGEEMGGREGEEEEEQVCSRRKGEMGIRERGGGEEMG
ncbi:hypothetical protein, partial [Escherichia coli]|uniref:hypothetical protein n=1 Tax=Escherichia coli TaxID=562 RepID=UPI001649A38C